MAYDHFSYFAQIAAKLPEIGSEKFLKASSPNQLEGLISNNSGLTGFVLVACSEAESKLSDSGNTAIFENPKFEFIILHPTTQDDNTTIFDAFNNCKNICKRIITRLFRDSSKGINSVPLQSLMPDSIQFDAVGPVANTWYGYLAAFTLKEPYNYTFNPEEWNE